MENILRNLRIGRGLTQRECAEDLGISVRTLMRYESGKPIYDSFIMHSIADYYGVTMDYLYENMNEPVYDTEMRSCDTDYGFDNG